MAFWIALFFSFSFSIKLNRELEDVVERESDRTAGEEIGGNGSKNGELV